jgi:recombinational DNA repair ATPase RecF
VAVEIAERPVVLLDDPFSALDPGRQRRVAERLRDRGQVFVSVADEAHVPAGADRVWAIDGGRVTERGLMPHSKGWRGRKRRANASRNADR